MCISLLTNITRGLVSCAMCECFKYSRDILWTKRGAYILPEVGNSKEIIRDGEISWCKTVRGTRWPSQNECVRDSNVNILVSGMWLCSPVYTSVGVVCVSPSATPHCDVLQSYVCFCSVLYVLHCSWTSALPVARLLLPPGGCLSKGQTGGTLRAQTPASQTGERWQLGTREAH